MAENAVLRLTADDAACKNEIDEAILQLASSGVVTHVAAFTNYGLAGSFCRRLGTSATAGIHLNLSSGKSLTDPSLISSLVDGVGRFHCPTPDDETKMHHSLATFLAERVPTFRPLHIKTELTAQIKAFQDEVGRSPAFCTIHHDLDQVPVVRDVMKSIFPTQPGRQALLESARLAGVFSTFLSPNDDLSRAQTKIRSMAIRALQVVRTNSSNVVEIVCHPGFASSDLSDFTVYIKQRELEFKVWANPSILSELHIVSRSVDGFHVDKTLIESVV
jgi:predicted glycoside hydrolase/deacetylase ChbG (UPF0249 family)